MKRHISDTFVPHYGNLCCASNGTSSSLCKRLNSITWSSLKTYITITIKIMSVNGMRTARIHILVTFDSLSIFQISGRIVYFSLCKKINKKIIIKNHTQWHFNRYQSYCHDCFETRPTVRYIQCYVRRWKGYVWH